MKKKEKIKPPRNFTHVALIKRHGGGVKIHSVKKKYSRKVKHRGVGS